MRGTGGLRKIRFAPRRAGAGKSVGARACYAYFAEFGLVYLCAVFPKNEKANLTASESEAYRKVLESFRRYLRERLTNKVSMKEFFEIGGNAADPQQACISYAEKVRSVDPQICLLGIGENGHLAFNDPAVADFTDPQDVKVVHLDEVCRQQQAAEGWFESVDEVAADAITLTIPIVLRVPKLIVSVPGSRKAEIMRRTFWDPISTACPATILRTHPDVTVYLDADSARYLNGVLPSQ